MPDPRNDVNQNPNLTPAARQLFTSMIAESGMPVTAAAMTEEWSKCNVAEGAQFTNSSEWSPFWRLITAIVTKPCQWVVNLLVEHALPNTHVRESGNHGHGDDMRALPITPLPVELTVLVYPPLTLSADTAEALRKGWKTACAVPFARIRISR